jgi:hypothetical protein
MATRILQKPTADDLRQAFKIASVRIRHTGEIPTPYTAPIRRTTRSDGPASEKRAVTDAARALAQLWRISPTLVR